MEDPACDRKADWFVLVQNVGKEKPGRSVIMTNSFQTGNVFYSNFIEVSSNAP
jgi:hypothetical protein